MNLTQCMFLHQGVFLATICLPSISLFQIEAMNKIQIKESCESCSEATVVCIKQFEVKTDIFRFSGVNRSSSSPPLCFVTSLCLSHQRCALRLLGQCGSVRYTSLSTPSCMRSTTNSVSFIISRRYQRKNQYSVAVPLKEF